MADEVKYGDEIRDCDNDLVMCIKIIYKLVDLSVDDSSAYL